MPDSVTSLPTQSTCPDNCGHTSPDAGLSTPNFLAHIAAGTWDSRPESASNLSTERAALASTAATARTEGAAGLTLERKAALRRQVAETSTALLVADHIREHSRQPTNDELAMLQTEGRAILKHIPALKFTWQEELAYWSRA